MDRLTLATTLALALAPMEAHPQAARHNTPGAGNPVLPGYFADPTVKKFGDTYYIYATTDGSGAGFGPAQLWQSKDFKNWTLTPMNWPDSHWIWAPDVMQGDDGRFYYLYCQPCKLHLGVGETPRGPWRNVLGESEAVLVEDRFVTNAITLDGQTFQDDDGQVYMYWGTWGIYKGFGCGSGRLNPDMKSFAETRLIPNTEATDFFEAPFVLKRGSTYYFMYSCGHCEDDSYQVRYATSDKPLGPYTYRGVVLKTNADGTVHGPGHHSVLREGDDYYIVYHRHDNPHSNRGFHRQVCIDKLEFAADGSIVEVVPTHDGVVLHPEMRQPVNLAFGAKTTASSYYDDDFRPEYATDDNNGTLWRPKTTDPAWLTVDLGKRERVRTIWTQFEYGTQFYQYLIETSDDGSHWDVFADKRGNRLAGSPMVDFGDVRARYVRLTVTGGQKAGFGGAVWNFKVFGTVEDGSPQQWLGLTAADFDGREWANSEGMLGGALRLTRGTALRERVGGKDAVTLSPRSTMVLANERIGKSRPHTFTAMVFDDGEWKQTTDSDPRFRLADGRLEIVCADKPLSVTDIRYYNWEQTEAERKFDAQTGIVRHEPASTVRRGLVVSIDADQYEEGDTVPYIANGGSVGGVFATQGESAATVQVTAGRKAITFSGRESYRSDFMLPPTLRDNAPYTLAATIFNPKMDVNECVADFTSSHDELEKIMLVDGTEPRCGVVNHYGWYEDAGHKKMVTLEGKWHDVYVCFDGRMESVYVDGRLVSHKDIQLLVKPSQFVTLGLNAEGEWPFSGGLGSLRLWDEYIPFGDKQ